MTKIAIAILMILTFSKSIFGQCPTHDAEIITADFQQFSEYLQTCKDFPDVTIKKEDNVIQIAYDRSRFRQGSFAASRLINEIQGHLPTNIEELEIAVQYRNTPLYTYQAPVDSGVIDISRNKYQIGRSFDEEMISRSGQFSNYNITATISPQVGFSFGSFNDPIQVQFNIIPNAQIRLWKGSQIHIELILPLWNELNIPEEEMIRPGLIVFSQFLRLGKGLFANLNLGYFNNYRYGAQLQAGKFFANGRFFAGIQTGYTGYASYPKRLLLEQPEPGWQISDLGYFDYQLMAGYRWLAYDLQFMATYGKGLFGQEIKMLAVGRQFKQLTVNFFVQELDEYWNYGLQVRVPIPFIRKFIGKRMTVQTGSFMEYNYNGTQHYPSVYNSGQLYPFLNNSLHPNIIYP